MKKKILLTIILLLLTACSQKNIMEPTDPNTIRYVAIGDSYSIGEGASQQESWPSLLTKHLQQENIKIELVANPSVTGWTTQDALDKEIPLLKEANADFATLLIGVNDYVQGVDETTFNQQFQLLLDEIQKEVNQNLVIVTIPDFSQLPAAKYFGDPKNIAQELRRFNEIITKQAKERNLSVIHLFELSQELNKKPEMVANDGLHPSAEAYAKWEELIYPIIQKKLL
ncbi:MAG: SGNH/GDSL hydrolase family protein [Nanoarchaeota archaeon]|nr:SGNH/GDSL hydrolase family protein [Nanoarchaeota archaeon]